MGEDPEAGSIGVGIDSMTKQQLEIDRLSAMKSGLTNGTGQNAFCQPVL